jgi:SAM-dependent methyltransferase
VTPQLQRRVQRYGWDKAVDHYEPHWKRQLSAAQECLLSLADLKRGERVLDVACGTGLVTFPAAQAVGTQGEVVGIDISGSMVERVANLAASRDFSQCRFERMGGESLQFEDRSFDVVLCGLGLMYFPDPLASLRDMARVTRAGGRLSVAVWGARNRCGWASIFPIVDARVESDVCPLFFRLGRADNLCRTAEEAGWTDIRVERLSVSLPYDSDEDAIAGAFAGGPVALAYSRFDERTREKAHGEYLQSISHFRNGNGYEIPGEFVVLAASKPTGFQTTKQPKQTGEPK